MHLEHWLQLNKKNIASQKWKQLLLSGHQSTLVLGHHCILFTDHFACLALLSSPPPSAKLARWTRSIGLGNQVKAQKTQIQMQQEYWTWKSSKGPKSTIQMQMLYQEIITRTLLKIVNKQLKCVLYPISKQSNPQKLHNQWLLTQSTVWTQQYKSYRERNLGKLVSVKRAIQIYKQWQLMK